MLRYTIQTNSLLFKSIKLNSYLKYNKPVSSFPSLNLDLAFIFNTNGAPYKCVKAIQSNPNYRYYIIIRDVKASEHCYLLTGRPSVRCPNESFLGSTGFWSDIVWSRPLVYVYTPPLTKSAAVTREHLNHIG